MSITRTPRLDAIRRREEEADARKVHNIVVSLIGLCAIAFVFGLVILVQK